MKRYILTIIIAAYGVCCHALPAEPDSLSRGRSYYDMAEEILSMDRYDYDGVLKLGHAAYSLLLEDKDLKGASDVMVLMSDVYESHADIDSVMICLDIAEAVLPPDMEEERLDIICRKKYWARKYDIQSLVLKLREQIRSVSESSDNPSVLISSYFDMAEDAAADKQISRAEALYLKAVELARKIHDTGLEYVIYGELYLMENRACQYGKALEYAMKALALSRKVDTPPGLDCYLVSDCLYNLGQTERARVYADSLLMIPADYVMNEGRLYQYSGALELLHGRPEKALSLLEKADSCMSVAVPQENPERVQILAQVGKALRLSGRMEESAQAYAAYSDYRCRLYGRESRYGFKGLRLYAEAEMLAGHYSVAEKLYSDISELMISRIKARMPYLTSEERPGYLSDMQDVAAAETEFASVSGNRCSAISGKAYDAHLMTKDLLLASERSVAEKVFGSADPEVRTAYYKVIALHDKLAELEASAADTVQIAEACRQLHSADIELSGLTGMTVFSNMTSVDFDTVSGALKDGEVLVDMIDYPSGDSHCYRAFVCRKGWTAPKIVDICAEPVLDSLADAAWRICEEPYASAAGDLFRDVLAQTSAGETLYIVPSGRFHSLPFESFRHDGMMLSERFNVVRLSSARELMSERKSLRKPLSAAVFGGLSSGIDATHEEIRNVSRALGRKSHVDIYAGADGTAENFRMMDCRAPEIIHIASHGFFYDAADTLKPASLAGRTSPMDLSGLVMYGGKLMSAEDIAGMNLDNAALVCLASCDSGLGKTSAEGVYGLQRAFRKAGAGTIIMSLWEASDVASAMFMSELYKVLVSGKCDVERAFRAAQSAVRSRYPEPFYWAGYVMIR
ncbi:MAG: CHAT domain-containing protein [Bacteroides sp.]|nr:CHAT domain-containing protein [Bacteroides sp.]